MERIGVWVELGNEEKEAFLGFWEGKMENRGHPTERPEKAGGKKDTELRFGMLPRKKKKRYSHDQANRRGKRKHGLR